jgi:hypothetical protein
MKNSTLLKYFGIILITSYLISCDARGLNAPMHNSYTKKNYWKTFEEVQSAINGVYDVLNTTGLYRISTSGGGIMSENFTPNAYGVGAGTPFVDGSLGPDNATILRNRWDDCYKGIGRANTVLANYKRANLSQKEADKIVGQALFLRALFYENLVFFYGGVPLILKEPNLEKQGALPRTSIDKVVERILEDLDNAAQKLPYSYDSGNLGRATKGAALALKARVLLYYASPLFNSKNDINRWEKAAKAAKKVIDIAPKAGYGLYPNYRDLFLENHEHNKEVIFNVEYSAPRYPSQVDIILVLQQNTAPLLGLVKSYDMKDGKTIDESPLYNPNKPYENRDPRLKQTIVVPGSMFMGKTANTDVNNITGFLFKKGTDYKDSVSYSNAPIRQSGLNTIILRYAEVLLSYAEAENEANGPDNSVYEVLNKIRDRVNMPHITSGLSKERMRKVIRHERRIELAGEGLYYMDIRRWKIADEVMNGPVYDSDGKELQDRKFVNREYFWPIPTTILERNRDLKQTPGYQ